jgi:type II secretory pathway pseudopilin PulG
MKVARAQGFALIDLVFVCGIIGLIAGIALPKMLQARQSAGAASAIGSMRAISSAELTYALTCGNGFYAPRLSTLGVPPTGSNQPFLGGGLTSADSVIKSGYTYQVDAVAFTGAPATCNGLGPNQASQGFVAAADPTESTNVRFFATNASGSIYEHSASLYVAMPEIGPPPSGHVLR